LGQFINFNGHSLDDAIPIVNASNRSLRYGDGLFESMRWENDRISLGDFHFQRLFHGLEILQMERPPAFTVDYFFTQIQELCKRNGREAARIRLNVFREESPALFPANNRPQFIIETADLPASNPEPLRLTVYPGEKKATGILSSLKTNSYLLSVMAAKYAQQNGFDDALILNARDGICEASSSNVFLIRDRTVFTPSLAEGCVAGVMRGHLMRQLPALGFAVQEISAGLEMLYEADEVFLTNAIRRIQPVCRLGDRRYRQEITKSLIENLFTPGRS
jgi:branched-chain amino acid aminotransferase